MKNTDVLVIGGESSGGLPFECNKISRLFNTAIRDAGACNK